MPSLQHLASPDFGCAPGCRLRRQRALLRDGTNLCPRNPPPGVFRAALCYGKRQPAVRPAPGRRLDHNVDIPAQPGQAFQQTVLRNPSKAPLQEGGTLGCVNPKISAARAWVSARRWRISAILAANWALTSMLSLSRYQRSVYTFPEPSSTGMLRTTRCFFIAISPWRTAPRPADARGSGRYRPWVWPLRAWTSFGTYAARTPRPRTVRCTRLDTYSGPNPRQPPARQRSRNL